MSNVGIVATSKPASGGTFQYTLSMIDALRKIKANDYTIFTHSTNHSYDNLELPIVRLPPAVRAIAEVAGMRLMSSVSGLFSEVDKVIAPVYTTYLLASRRPFLFTLHDLQERYYPQNFTFAQRMWRSLANKSLAKAAAGIICESNYVKSDIQKFLAVDPSRIQVIPAPPVSAFLPQHLDANSFHPCIDGRRIPKEFLFYPAQFFPHKNHLRLIEAFSLVSKAYPNCHLILTGQAKYSFDEAMDRVAELGLKNRVTHLGYVDTNTLASVYMRATIIVIPTLFESISIPVYEAFQLGVPVCASNVVALPGQIGDAGILFDPRSPDDMAEKIMNLLKDKDMQVELVRRGRAKVKGLTSEAYADQLQVALDKIA